MGSMFTIVALVYVINAGVTPEEPLALQSKHTFVGLEKCQEYMKSEEFAAERLWLHRSISQSVAMKAMAAPDAPVPSVAITASCQEDNRI